MALSELIEIVSWSLWIVAGIIIALIAAGFSGRRHMLFYDLVVGIVLAIVGGICSSVSGGDVTKSQLIVSVLVACLCSGAGVYVLNLLTRPRQ